MTSKQMEQDLAKALKKTAPNNLQGVLSRCEERKGTVFPMTEKKTPAKIRRTLAAACLAAALLGPISAGKRGCLRCVPGCESEH